MAVGTTQTVAHSALFGTQPLGQGRVETLVQRITGGEPVAIEDALITMERLLVEAALEKTGDNLTEAAQLLGISFRQIRYKVRQLGLR